MKILYRILMMIGLKRETNIRSITKPIASIVSKLDAYAEEQAARAAANKEAAEALKLKSDEERQMADKARALASRYSSLIA